MSAVNPFRLRMTEQLRDSSAFLRTFGAEMLDALPFVNDSSDRLVVFRSAPGAGKTSLLRIVTPESLLSIVSPLNRQDDAIQALRVPLEARGFLTGENLNVLAVMIGLGNDYRSLIDLVPDGAAGEKAFFRLLDWRILAKAIESILTASHRSFPDDADQIEFVFKAGAEGSPAKVAFTQLSRDGEVEITDPPSVNGADLLRLARHHERGMLDLLDSLLPVNWNGEIGHSKLYALPFLANSVISVAGKTLRLRPLVLFDDVHVLADTQRAALWNQLIQRQHRIGRWVAEQTIVASDEEILTGTRPGRDYDPIAIEETLGSGPRGGKSLKLTRMLSNIANSRARTSLATVGVNEDFTNLLLDPFLMPLEVQEAALTAELENLTNLCTKQPQYRSWFLRERPRWQNLEPLRAAILARELRILINRDLRKSGPTLFDFDADEVEPTSVGGSDTRAAARLLLSKEQNLPYYAGPDMLAELSSKNVEQYLGLSGDLYELVAGTAMMVTPNQGYLDPYQQDRQIRRSSQALWDAIPQRVLHGNDVHALLWAIAAHSNAETFTDRASYAPGVTGTAYNFYEGRELLKNAGRKPGSPLFRLANALREAIAYNFLEPSSGPTPVKGQVVTVLYLNRLLAPHFDLPLQRGGFRELPISTLARRMVFTADFIHRRGKSAAKTMTELDAWPS